MAGRNKFAKLAAAMSPERQAEVAAKVAKLREELALTELHPHRPERSTAAPE